MKKQRHIRTRPNGKGYGSMIIPSGFTDLLNFCETNISMGLFNRILGSKLKVEDESFVNWIPLNSLDQIKK